MTEPTPVTWLVGSRGLIGRHIAVELERRGAPWISVPVNWSEPESATKVLRETAAALVDPDRPQGWQVIWCAGVGTTGTAADEFDAEHRYLESVLEALSGGTRGRFFLASSAGGVYAGSRNPPFDESTQPQPLSPYGHAKLRAEATVTTWCSTTGSRAVLGRISNVFGPGQDLAKPQGLISHLCASHVAHRQCSIWVPLDTLRDYIFAADAAALILDCLERIGAPGRSGTESGHSVVKIIASGRPVSLGSIIGELRRIFRTRPAIVLGVSEATSMQSANVALVSRVWTDLDRRTLTTLPAGIESTLRDISRRYQLAANQ